MDHTCVNDEDKQKYLHCAEEMTWIRPVLEKYVGCSLWLLAGNLQRLDCSNVRALFVGGLCCTHGTVVVRTPCGVHSGDPTLFV